MDAMLSLYLTKVLSIVTLSGICIGAGIMSKNWVNNLLRLNQELLIWNLGTLLQSRGCRLGSDSLDMVSRLDLTIIWAYILWRKRGPLIVTAQYGCHPRSIYSYITFPGVRCTSAFNSSWMVRTDCRKELDSLK